MTLYLIYFCLLLCVRGISSDEIKQILLSDDISKELECFGEEYSYIDGKCYCALEYVPNYTDKKCIKCPGLGESCDGRCCSSNGINANETLQCREGVCQHCHNNYGDWICRDSLTDALSVGTITEIAISIIFILGLFGGAVLIYTICNMATKRFRCNRIDTQRPSVGSLQQIVEERLRDAPPRYSSTAGPGAQIVPVTIYLIEGFVHDSSLPPPPYTPEEKTEEQINATLHL